MQEQCKPIRECTAALCLKMVVVALDHGMLRVHTCNKRDRKTIPRQRIKRMNAEELELTRDVVATTASLRKITTDSQQYACGRYPVKRNPKDAMTSSWCRRCRSRNSTAEKKSGTPRHQRSNAGTPATSTNVLQSSSSSYFTREA
jgi:hypothetical protein